MSKKAETRDQNIIVVDGLRIPTEVKELPIDEVKYWRENPRVDSIIKQRFPDGSATEDDIEQALWGLESVKELFQDIKQNGGLIDEILVKGEFVLEGNSRLCAYRHLFKKATTDDERMQWLGIRARIIPESTSSEAIFSILGTWHIKGKAEWKTFEKAAYIARIHREYGKTTKEISMMLKRSEVEVKNMIETYDLMQRKGISESQDQKKFSAVYEIIKNREMRKIREKEPGIFDSCINAVRDGRFERAEKVRDLPKIIKDKKARKAFFDEHENVDTAAEIAKARHPEHADSFYRVIRRASSVLEECSAKRIEEIRLDGSRAYELKRLQKAIAKVLKLIGASSD
jgi:hypothetical protein